MPFTGTLPSHPTALRKMLVDLGLTPASHNPHALRQQLMQHYDAHPEAIPASPVAQAVPVPQPVPPARAPAVVPSNPTNAPRTIEAIIEENKNLVAGYQKDLADTVAYVNSVWTPVTDSGYYWISKNAVSHLPGWGYGGYISTNSPNVGVPLNQYEYNQASYAVNNYIEGIRNRYQSAIDVADRAAEAEIKELQRSRLSVSVSPVISVNPAVPKSVSSLRRIGFPRTGSSAPIPVPQGDFMRGILNKEIRDPDEGKDHFAYTLKSKEPVYDQDLLRGIFRRKDGQ